MTDTDPIEQRLRRTFRFVAEQPVTPLGDPEPWRTRVTESPSRRRARMMGGGLVIVVVIALIVLGVTYGPRSTQVTTHPGAGPPSGTTRAVFAPVRPVSDAILEEAAAAMTARMHALGDSGASSTIDHGSIVLTGSTFTGPQMHVIGSTGDLEFRPVLCGAPDDTSPPPPQTPGTSPQTIVLPPCGAQYATTASNLSVNTNSGQPTNTIGPDPAFATVPSTPEADDEPATSVLLPADPAAGAQQYPRFVLGAAQFGNAGIAGAQAQLDTTIDSWIVDLTLTTSGATEWNAMAQLNFHQYVAIILDGGVLSAPLIEPASTTFSNFGNKMVISGNFNATLAKDLAAVLSSGPLPVGFTLQSLTTVSAALG
jgi:preprotein translocase subunit SecD